MKGWLADMLGLDDSDVYRSAERAARLRIEARRQDPDASLSRSSMLVCRRILARWHAEEIRQGRSPLKLVEKIR